MVAGLVAVVAGLLAYRTLAPRARRRRPYDAGSVSNDWLAHHKNPPDH